MKYPLTPAEERLKAKIAKQKAERLAPPEKIRKKKYIKTVYKSDFLKYWKLIRYWVRHKYGITQHDLDIMFFLYSEGYFMRSDIKEFESLFPWDKKRFKRLLDEGWIHIFRKPARGQPTLYEISHKGHQMVKDIYNKLNGEGITERASLNPMFRNDATYAEKVHRNYIKKLNKSIQQERRHARVSRYKLRHRESLYALRNGQTESGPQQP
jgi:hypothetical protein